MIVKLLTGHHLEFLSCRDSSSLHLSKCQIVGNLMPGPIFLYRLQVESYIHDLFVMSPALRDIPKNLPVYGMYYQSYYRVNP